MAEGGSDEIVEKIACGLCYEEYKQPKLLPCFHSFCLECLEKYVETNRQNNTFDCPLCDTTIEIPEGGVNQFERNIYLDSKLESETNEPHDCDLCGPKMNATNHCINCEENYCERCSEMHMKQRMSRTHTLVGVSGSKTGCQKVIKKMRFCTKHPNDEIRVVCKDCDKMLCLVCKLTDHEKHNSVDIEDEALNMKKNLKEVVCKAQTSVSKLGTILEHLNAVKYECCKNRETTIKHLRDHGRKFKEHIDMKISEIEISVNRQWEDVCNNVESFSTGAGKIRTAITTLSMHATKMVSLNDVASSTMAAQLQKQLENCIVKAENLKVEKQDVYFNRWEKTWSLVSCSLGQSLINFPSAKSINKLGECKYTEGYISNNVCSIATALDYCVMSCTDVKTICVVNAPGRNFEHPGYVCDHLSICAAADQVFISVTAKKEVNVWNRSTQTITDIHKSLMYPHGIAHRPNSEQGELLICLLLDDDDLMSIKHSRGMVKVLRLGDTKASYDFIAEIFPAPTRVAVSKLDGLVCLSYPSVGKISVHTKAGLTIHCFDGQTLYMDRQLFRPFGVCFDNENCIIIADRDGGQVLRVSLLGQVIQTLVKGNKPTAVGVGPDDKLWVGYEDKNVTVFRMSNKDV